ncbi:class GN sortase [Dasania sp. GY-MA-18]|uniref:Class GN sortase n=1 Tax=Dasania phycosphaerae TaxID=2950436 RepID=A0A9J6RKC5_9GAMM|nr:MULTISPECIES: class GN sortase [Dasania]MCR8922720.1 class GN sortase [Dasania sp. GY-MA-18]MCZ0865150.1 class GN sortase [Dasania phycosphaerae]MCZ0868876.1 class GN sortase [Dasania phycosphaerae]
MSRRSLVAGVLLLLALLLLLDSLWIKAKAHLAQGLIRHAWQQSLSSGEPVKPWPWADTWPVGRLQLPSLNVDLTILHGAQGNALAFGPGHVLASADLNSGGTTVLAGHRDTHFAFMQHLKKGDELLLSNRQGKQQSYEVSELAIVNSQQQSLALAASSALVLVTCYPFNSLSHGGPLRYVLTATAI